MTKYRPHLFIACALAAALLTGVPDALRNFLLDLRFHYFPRQASGDVVLVAIDSPSIEAIGVWPWPRRIHADLLDKLEGAGASDIAFDIDFSTASSPQSDEALIAALKKAADRLSCRRSNNGSTSGGARSSISIARCHNSARTHGQRLSTSPSSPMAWCVAIRLGKRLTERLCPRWGPCWRAGTTAGRNHF